MKLRIKQYEYQKIEVESKVIDLPTETCYFFETGIRRSIKIIPRFTTWNKEQYGKEEELYELEVICLYNSFECKAEKFKIQASSIEGIYYSKVGEHISEHRDFIVSLIDGDFYKRTKEQFDADLNDTLSQIQCL